MKILKKYLFLIIILIFLIVFFYGINSKNSLTLNVPIQGKYNVRVFLISKSSTITVFKNCNDFLNVKISAISKGHYKLRVYLYKNTNLTAKSAEVPLDFSYFTNIKVSYLKFDYIN